MMNNNIFQSAAEVKNFVNNSIRGGQRGVCILACVSMDSQIDKAHKDMLGRIDKVVLWADRPLVSYSGNVNAKASEEFIPNARKGFTWTQYPIFEKANKSGAEYLTFSYRECDRGEYYEKYFLDGALVSKDDIKCYLKPKKEYVPKTQIEVGVVKKEEFSKCVRYELGKCRVSTNKEEIMKVFKELG